MLDIKLISNDPEKFNLAMRQRGEDVIAVEIIALDVKVRECKTLLQELNHRRNQIAKNIGVLKSQHQDIKDELLKESEEVNSKIEQVEADLALQENDFNAMMSQIPNIPECDVPFGLDETSNKLIRACGERREFHFKPQSHLELGERLLQMSFAEAVQMSGSRFVVLKQTLALMERALANFMLDNNIYDFGYTEISPPYLVHDSAVFNTGQLPKFAADLFRTQEGFNLIPTAEVPLTNLVAGQILNSQLLPLRFTASTPCFRSEAGSAGRDTRGMLRQHQFHKVELVSITKPEESGAELERIVNVAESILQKLDLPYRVMLLCSQDMGFSAQKTYDIEVWMPSQDRYREISSCSNCGDFQARRMMARYKEGKMHYVHTLNGSALAIGRTMIAIMENYQCENGDIMIPNALRKYMNNMELIECGAIKEEMSAL